MVLRNNFRADWLWIWRNNNSGSLAQLAQSSHQLSPAIKPNSSHSGGQILELASDLDNGRSSVDSVAGGRFGNLNNFLGMLLLVVLRKMTLILVGLVVHLGMMVAELVILTSNLAINANILDIEQSIVS